MELLTGGDAKFYNERLYKCHLWTARAYCQLGDEEQAAASLNRALECAHLYESRPQTSRYDVYWLSDIEDDRAAVWKDDRHSLYEHLLQEIAGEQFALLHGTAAYEELRGRIAEYCA